MAAFERLKRINDFHRIYPSNKCMKLELKARSYGSGFRKSSGIGLFCGFSAHTS
jgi:predicted PolB exonuclease-like 3'-5' exonuclease